MSRVSVFCCLMNAIDLCKTEGTIDVFQVLQNSETWQHTDSGKHNNYVACYGQIRPSRT